MSNFRLIWLKAPLLSPKGLVARAIIIAIAFALCHCVGLREHTSFLSGTSASADTNLTFSALLGVTYIGAYLAFVIFTPILLMAAAIQAVLRRYSC